MPSSFSRELQVGRGLKKIAGYAIEVLPDGVTLNFDTNNQLYIPLGAITGDRIANGSITTSKLSTEPPAVSTANIQDYAVTLKKVDVGVRTRRESRYYSTSVAEVHIPSIYLLENEKLTNIYLASYNTWASSDDYWSISIYSIGQGQNTWTQIVQPVALVGTTTWEFSYTLTPNYYPQSKRVISVYFTAIGNPGEAGLVVCLFEIQTIV